MVGFNTSSNLFGRTNYIVDPAGRGYGATYGNSDKFRFGRCSVFSLQGYKFSMDSAARDTRILGRGLRRILRVNF